MDNLASEYGWTKDYILDYMCPSEVNSLIEIIKNRKRQDSLLELAITHNPYAKDPNILFRELKQGTEEMDSSDSKDSVGLDSLKRKLKGKSKFIKVKK